MARPKRPTADATTPDVTTPANPAPGTVGQPLSPPREDEDIAQLNSLLDYHLLTIDSVFARLRDSLTHFKEDALEWARRERGAGHSLSHPQGPLTQVTALHAAVFEALVKAQELTQREITECRRRGADLATAAQGGQSKTLVVIDLVKSELMTRYVVEMFSNERAMLDLQRNMLDFIEAYLDKLGPSVTAKEEFEGDGIKFQVETPQEAHQVVEGFFQELGKANAVKQNTATHWHFRAYAATGPLHRGTSGVRKTASETGLVYIDFARIAQSKNCVPGQFLVDEPTFQGFDLNCRKRYTQGEIDGKHPGTKHTVFVATFLPPPLAEPPKGSKKSSRKK